MTKASDNDFPSVLLTEQASAPASPAAGKQRVYIRTSDHTLVTVNSSGTVTPVGTAGSGMTHTYIGYNTAGGSFETMTSARCYAKKITLAAAGMLTSIGAYVKDDGADHVGSLSVALYEDNAGTPRYILAANPTRVTSLLPETATSTTAPRWLHVPIGIYLPAGDYWLAVMGNDTFNLLMAYDAAGSDRYYTAGGNWFADWGYYTPTTGSNKYSIRGSLIS